MIDVGHTQGHEDLPAVPSANCSGQYGGCDESYSLGHGSHVLGIWTARNNAVGVVGVAPGVANADVYVYGACDNLGECYSTSVAAGINAGIWTADVINLSLQMPYDAATANAVAQAWNNDIVLVASAGNNMGPTVVYPAGYANVVGVSGVRTDGSFASWSLCVLPGGGSASSNYGSHVDLAAPFWALSAVPSGYQDETDGWCGNSMATPHVSGAAVLLRSQHPTWTNQQVVERLFATAEDRGATGRDNYYGYGIVDAAEAVGYIPPPPPFYVYAEAPGLVTVKRTYSLNGSASEPASGWQWDRSYEGSPWEYWSSNQNSQFIAYAGRYTLGWQLFARRNSDGATNYGYATTQVCIPYNPSTCREPQRLAAPAVTESETGTHFGSGVWVGVRGPLGNAAVRFYSFLGRHDITRGASDWPNLLDRESVDWAGVSGVGIRDLQVASRRVVVAPGIEVYRVSGRIDGLTGLGEVAVGLAADPDLAAPHDDRIRFDSDLGLVSVYDGSSDYLGYVALAAGPVAGARVHQFDVGIAEEPSQAADAYQAMLESSSLDPNRPTDVRFVLTVPRVAVSGDGRFNVSFALLRAGNIAALRGLAVAARQEFGAIGSVMHY